MIDIFVDLPTTILTPPTIPGENKTRNWFSIPNPDPVAEHLTTDLWDQENSPQSWLVAQLSPAAYIYREQVTGWNVVAKFYSSKTKNNAIRHAEHEFQRIQQARERLGPDREFRSVQPLGLWGGALFLEFVEGLTLEDIIAIRRSQPGELCRILKIVGKLLSKLHLTSIQQKPAPDFGVAADYAYKLVDNLAQYGVLQNQPIVQSRIGQIIEKWVADALMWDFHLTLNHGDATTTNFIFPPDGGVVAIDWERSELADPAADLGRLMAEVTHSVNQNGGDFAEGLAFANELAGAYCNELVSNWNTDRLIHRAWFYQATSTLRIARNGWLSRQDRMALVVQALALLS